MKYFICVWVVLLTVLTGNAQNFADPLNIDLKTGDLLFCGTSSGELSKAIDQVTQTGKETHFDHVGIIDIQKDTVYILHSLPKKGVCREALAHFIFSYKGKVTISIYRLNDKSLKAIPSAIQKAYTLLGQPYNYSYILKDPGLYCSEYIYEIFSSDSIFTQNPMTFKDPKTGQFLSGWVDHYHKLGIPIPEGEPGCNPNGMAASEKLGRIGNAIIKYN